MTLLPLKTKLELGEIMKTRNQIDNKFKWDIELFKTEQEIKKAFEDLEFLTTEVTKFNGQFNNKEMFFEYFLNFVKNAQTFYNSLCILLINHF